MVGARSARSRRSKSGTTAIIDHHSSPNAIEGSLDVIAQACAEVGVRVVCCYEVTDRNGADGAKAGLAENERFLRAGGRGLVGAHACFTLSDETLDAVCGLAADLGVGVHVHVAEDPVDAAAGERLADARRRRLDPRPRGAPRPRRCPAPSCTTRARTSTTRSATAGPRASRASRSAPTASAPTCSTSSGSRSRSRAPTT